MRTSFAHLRAALLFAGLAGVCIVGVLGWRWSAMTRDLEREGALVGVVGCIVPPDPELDWSLGGRRDFVWAALAAPGWLVRGATEKVREGAESVLRRSARAEDAQKVLRLAIAGRYDARGAGVQLGLAWLARGDGFRAEALELLAGDDRRQALALLALPIVTGWRIEDLAPRAGQRWTLRDPGAEERIERTFGAPRAALVEEWRAWLAARADRGLAELHTELVARLWSIEELDSRQAAHGLRLGHLLGCIGGLGPEWARRAVGPLGPRMSRFDWRANEPLRRAAIQRLLAQEPVALDAATLLECVEFSAWSALF